MSDLDLDLDLVEAEAAFEARFQRMRDLVAELGSNPVVAARAECFFGDPDDAEKELAFDLLAVAITPDERELVPLLVALANQVTAADGVDLRWAVAHALGSTDDARVLEPLIRFAADPDSDIRWLVAVGIPIDAEVLPAEVVDVVLTLMTDECDEVRDWATFSMSQHPENDSPVARQALVERLSDEHDETVCSAVQALAARNDPRALPGLVERLERPAVSTALLGAAEELADPGLLPLLVAIRSEGRISNDDYVHRNALTWAIEACQQTPADADPGR